MSYSLPPHGLQDAKFPYPCLSTSICSNLCPLSLKCYLTISSFTSLCYFGLQSFPASESFPMSQLFASHGQSIGASVSVPLKNIQIWFPLGLTDLISLLSNEGTCVTQWSYESCHAGPYTLDGSWWKVLTKYSPLVKKWQTTLVFLLQESHQLCVCVYVCMCISPLFFRYFSHISHYRVLNKVTWATQ